MDALPRLQLARTLAERRRLVESIASSQEHDPDQTLHLLNVANFFADALLDDALPPNDPQFWADDAQELASLDNQDRTAFDAFLNRLTSMREDLKTLRQRQQAQAVVAARTKIVEGAVTMVQMALEQLAEHEIVELDAERKAAMVSNLLVVLCGDRHTQPVINTGSLY